MFRRFTQVFWEGRMGGDDMPSPPLPGRQIFKYYAVYGDRDADGSSMRSNQFAKLL